MTGVCGRKIIRWRNSHLGASGRSKCWTKVKVFMGWGRPPWLPDLCLEEREGRGPGFSRGESSAPPGSLPWTSGLSHTEYAVSGARCGDIPYRSNHTGKVLQWQILLDRPSWNQRLAWPTSDLSFKIWAFLLLCSLLGKTKQKPCRPVKRYICFILNNLFCLQKQMLLLIRWGKWSPWMEALSREWLGRVV